MSASERGAALIELAVALPLLVIIIVGTADLARVFYMSMELTNAARAGAQYGTSTPARAFDRDGIINAAVNAAVNLSLTSGNVTVATPPPQCWCAPDDGASFTLAGSCTSTCSGGGHIVETVTVTVSKSFTTFAVIPGFPSSFTVTRTATLRVAN